MVNHRPFQLGIKKYGDLAIPVSEDDLFWHILKNRNGTIPILRMTANFKNMEINEYEK